MVQHIILSYYLHFLILDTVWTDFVFDHVMFFFFF